jgi:preprotein translocase subunit YajC
MSTLVLGLGLWALPFDVAQGIRSVSRGVGFPWVVTMATPGQGAPSAWVQLMPFVLVLAIFYFVILMPMKKRQQKVQAFLAALKVGDRIVTSGGIYGQITRLNEQSVQVQIANNVRIEIARSAVVGYQGQEPVAPESGQS